MACNNDATLVRFVVEARVSCGTPQAPIANMNTTPHTFSSVTKLTGLDLGEEGTVEVPFWGRKAQMADGIRTFKPLGIQLRIPQTPFAPGSDFAVLAAMFDQRSALTYDIDVWITDRAFVSLMLVRFYNADMKKFSFEDMELGAAKVGLVDTEFLPRDARLFDCKGVDVIIDSPGANSNPLVICP